MQARFNAKYAVFSVIAIMTVYVLCHNERFLVEPENPVWQRYKPVKWWLLPHGIPQHRQWMIRSYAVALVFIEGRFILGVTGWGQLGVEMAQAVIWSCLALSIPMADLANHWLEIRAALQTPVGSPATVKQGALNGAVEPI